MSEVFARYLDGLRNHENFLKTFEKYPHEILNFILDRSMSES